MKKIKLLVMLSAAILFIGKVNTYATDNNVQNVALQNALNNNNEQIRIKFLNSKERIDDIHRRILNGEIKMNQSQENPRLFTVPENFGDNIISQEVEGKSSGNQQYIGNMVEEYYKKLHIMKIAEDNVVGRYHPTNPCDCAKINSNHVKVIYNKFFIIWARVFAIHKWLEEENLSDVTSDEFEIFDEELNHMVSDLSKILNKFFGWYIKNSFSNTVCCSCCSSEKIDRVKNYDMAEKVLEKILAELKAFIADLQKLESGVKPPLFKVGDFSKKYEKKSKNTALSENKSINNLQNKVSQNVREEISDKIKNTKGGAPNLQAVDYSMCNSLGNNEFDKKIGKSTSFADFLQKHEDFLKGEIEKRKLLSQQNNFRGRLTSWVDRYVNLYSPQLGLDEIDKNLNLNKNTNIDFDEEDKKDKENESSRGFLQKKTDRPEDKDALQNALNNNNEQIRIKFLNSKGRIDDIHRRILNGEIKMNQLRENPRLFTVPENFGDNIISQEVEEKLSGNQKYIGNRVEEYYQKLHIMKIAEDNVVGRYRTTDRCDCSKINSNHVKVIYNKFFTIWARIFAIHKWLEEENLSDVTSDEFEIFDKELDYMVSDLSGILNKFFGWYIKNSLCNTVCCSCCSSEKIDRVKNYDMAEKVLEKILAELKEFIADLQKHEDFLKGEIEKRKLLSQQNNFRGRLTSWVDTYVNLYSPQLGLDEIDKNLNLNKNTNIDFDKEDKKDKENESSRGFLQKKTDRPEDKDALQSELNENLKSKDHKIGKSITSKNFLQEQDEKLGKEYEDRYPYKYYRYDYQCIYPWQYQQRDLFEDFEDKKDKKEKENGSLRGIFTKENK